MLISAASQRRRCRHAAVQHEVSALSRASVHAFTAVLSLLISRLSVLVVYLDNQLLAGRARFTELGGQRGALREGGAWQRKEGAVVFTITHQEVH